jgi:hypothetical protein
LYVDFEVIDQSFKPSSPTNFESSSDLDLDLFQAPVKTSEPSDQDSDFPPNLHPDLALFQETLKAKTIDITLPTLSPQGVHFMPSSPLSDPRGIEPFAKGLGRDYIAYLEVESCNRCVLTGLKRMIILNHLKDPMSKPSIEYTRKQKIRFANEKFDALNHYEIQDNQVYRKAATVHGIELNARYCACIWDSYEIICKVHLQLHHFGKFLLFYLV